MPPRLLLRRRRHRRQVMIILIPLAKRRRHLRRSLLRQTKMIHLRALRPRNRHPRILRTIRLHRIDDAGSISFRLPLNPFDSIHSMRQPCNSNFASYLCVREYDVPRCADSDRSLHVLFEHSIQLVKFHGIIAYELISPLLLLLCICRHAPAFRPPKYVASSSPHRSPATASGYRPPPSCRTMISFPIGARRSYPPLLVKGCRSSSHMLPSMWYELSYVGLK